jgi:hypothetical protein
MIYFNKYRSAVATRPNSAEEYKRPDGLAVRVFDLRMEGYWFESQWRLFPFYFSIYF